MTRLTLLFVVICFSSTISLNGNPGHAQESTDSESSPKLSEGKLQQQKEAWDRLSTDDKKRILAAYKEIQKMDPKARKRLLTRLKTLTPDQQNQLGDILQKFKKEKPENRQRARRSFRERELWLKTQSPEVREQISSFDRSNRKRHYEERLMRFKKHLLNKVPDDLLDEDEKRRLLEMNHQDFRRNISRLIRQEISSQVSDRTMSFITELEALKPPQITAFLRHGKFPPDRLYLQEQFQILDDQEKKDIARFLRRIHHKVRPKKPGDHNRPHDRGNRPGRGADSHSNETPRKGEIRPPRRTRPGTPPARPDLQQESDLRSRSRHDSRRPSRTRPNTMEASLDLHSHQG